MLISGAFNFGAASAGHASSFKFGVSTAATNDDLKPTDSDPAKYDENKHANLFGKFINGGLQSDSDTASVFGSSVLNNQNAVSKSSAVKNLASIFAMANSSNRTSCASSGAAATLFWDFGKPALPQPAAGSVLGKGVGQMRELGPLFGEPKCDDLQTASGNCGHIELS